MTQVYNHHTEPLASNEPLPRIIAWELTRRCPNACLHCRAAAVDSPYQDEFTTEQCRQVLDNIVSFASPLMIFTGGEPLLRADIDQLIRYAHSLGLRTALATCGHLLNGDRIEQLKTVGLDMISLSLDGSSAIAHDKFRRQPGSFDTVIQAAQAAQSHQLPFQINTTVTRRNQHQLPEILEFARRLGAAAFNAFLLVPVGRGVSLIEEQLSPSQYEQTLQWLAERYHQMGIKIRVTCAPHYQRILREFQTVCGPQPRHPAVMEHPGGHLSQSGRDYYGGCLGGKSFAFISHTGRVQICGFLEHPAGELCENQFDFKTIWQKSSLFQQVRNVNGYHGKCGHCEYRKVCGGCRARAFAADGDILGPEPYCVYEPQIKP